VRAEATALDAYDVAWERGPFGKLHVRFGKAAPDVGAAGRVGADVGRLGGHLGLVSATSVAVSSESAVLFCDESGGRLATARSATGSGI